MDTLFNYCNYFGTAGAAGAEADAAAAAGAEAGAAAAGADCCAAPITPRDAEGL